MASNLAEPAPQRTAGRVELVVLSPERHEHVLNDLFGGRRVDDARGDREDEGCVTLVEQAKRALVALAEPADELLVHDVLA
jgi:hypothetical protein